MFTLRLYFFKFLLLVGFSISPGEELNPPFFNLAEVATIRATSTCGDQGPELYCNPFASLELSDIEHCDVCYKDKQTESHSINYAIDGSTNTWHSPPLTRGSQYEQANVTIDLGRQFEVAYFFMTMGISPRPAVWALEKSMDYGSSWTPWQYFARNETECRNHFGDEVEMSISRDDSVICNTEFSRVTPFHDGQVIVSFINGRPSANVTSRSEVLRDWMRATNVRLRLIKMYKLEQSKKKYGNHINFYSIRDISMGGRCVCNGHAATCEEVPSTTSIPTTTTPGPAGEGSQQATGNNNKMSCGCENNTCGDDCSTCCPGYQRVPWRAATEEESFSCQSED